MTATLAVIDEFEVLDRTGGSGTAMVAARAHNLLNVKERSICYEGGLRLM
jgi:hypothetical protein